MPRPLNPERKLKRTVFTLRNQVLTVELEQHGIRLREKGRKTSYLLPYGHAFLRAADLHARELRREKALQRKLRREAKSRGEI
jgi:hypothetical protein